MFNSTSFAQLLKPLRQPFNQYTTEHKSDKHSKGFSSWQQLVAMVYAQFNGLTSLREITNSFNAKSSHHYHLGVKSIPKSTLAEANIKKSPEPYIELCNLLIAQANSRLLKKELKQFTYLIDSSPIQLLGQGFEWAPRGSRVKGMKLHLQLELSQKLPKHFEITTADHVDVYFGHKMTIEEGSKYIFDAGYNHYGWWHKIHKDKATFITRPHRNAAYKIVDEHHSQSEPNSNILQDAEIHLNSKTALTKANPGINSMKLRRIEIDRPDKAKSLIVKIQLFTARIAYLLIKLEQSRSTKPQEVALGKLWTETVSTLFSRPKSEDYYRKRKEERQAYEKLQLSLL
jgi:putative transposase